MRLQVPLDPARDHLVFLLVEWTAPNAGSQEQVEGQRSGQLEVVVACSK
jgi:hypothetical protein